MAKLTKAQEEELKYYKRLSAFRLTGEVKPDVAPPSSFVDIATGWYVVYDRVSQGCSSSVHHSTRSTAKTDSQGARWMYSTKELALKALRNSVEQRCLSELYNIDNLIRTNNVKMGTN